MAIVRSSRGIRRAGLPALAVLLLPLLLVHIVPSDTVEPYVFEARLAEDLGQSANGQLRYARADVLQGEAPAGAVVVALDRSYTRGWAPGRLPAGSTAWFQGGLMTPDVFYGEQYLFFGLPQVYVRQVKSGLLWPDQWTGMRVLYLSPLATLAAPVQIPFLVRSDSFTWTMLAVLTARCALLAATIVLLAKRRLRGAELVRALLAFATAAMLLTMPMLGNLY